LLLSVLLAPLLAGVAALEPAAEPSGGEIADILRRYMEATRAQHVFLRDVRMEVEMVGELPGLHKSGKMRATRMVSALGHVTYKDNVWQGDNTIKKDVIARYMQAEIEATGNTGLSINPDNYKFKYRGLFGSGDWELHLFEVTPRKKRVGLFKGFLWLHARTCLPVREQGEFVKSPSIFLKKITFIRDYQIRTGIALPQRIASTIETRLVGKALLNIQYANFVKPDQTLADGASRSPAERPPLAH
jgi:hypothetical protein